MQPNTLLLPRSMGWSITTRDLIPTSARRLPVPEPSRTITWLSVVALRRATIVLPSAISIHNTIIRSKGYRNLVAKIDVTQKAFGEELTGDFGVFGSSYQEQ